MIIEILLRYIHFISIFAIVASLSVEHFLLKNEMSRAELARLSRIDAVYGIAALTLLAAGLTLWLGGFGKPSDFYSLNAMFHLKLSLFAGVGLLSIYPTMFFIKQRKGNQREIVGIPPSMIWILRTELALLLMIPLVAGLMARGIGFDLK